MITDSEFNTVLNKVIASLRLIKNRTPGMDAWDILDEAHSILHRCEE